MKDAEHAVSCIDEPLTAPDVVTYFQLAGLAAFLEDDKARARDAFRAAQGVLPDYALPSTVATTGDAWYEMYEALRSMPDDARAELTVPKVGWIQVDGARSEEHPSARPWLFQQFDGAGGVVKTEVVWTRQPPPAYETDVAEAPPPPMPVAPVSEPHTSRGLAIAGGAVAAAGLGSLIGAGALRAKYNSPDTPPERADQLIGRDCGAM